MKKKIIIKIENKNKKIDGQWILGRKVQYKGKGNGQQVILNVMVRNQEQNLLKWGRFES